MRAKIELNQGDCVDAMKDMDDNAYDLAIVDPPYGIGENWKKDRHSQFYKHESSYKNNIIPDAEYFKHLFRVSKNQIIWGANYYSEFIGARNSWVVWDKKRCYIKQHLAEGELAWTSYNIPLRIAEFRWNGAVVCEPRYGKHPHEKPIGLYKWLLQNYAKEGDKILDTHLGSGSIAVACWDLKFDLTTYELDEDYYADACKRFNNHYKQGQLF